MPYWIPRLPAWRRDARGVVMVTTRRRGAIVTDHLRESVGRERLRSAAWRFVPGLMADRARAYESGMRARAGLTALAERFAREYGDRVLHGPVAGLRLVFPRLGEIDEPTARLLGCYELEIQPALCRALRAKPSRFIDLGCADGYFAVGVAVVGKVMVDAFDLSKSARSLTMETAALNGVDHLVTTHAAATSAAVARLPLAGALLMCDIEGHERELFTENLVARLATARVIIEMHSKVHTDVETVLVNRFRPTHDVTVVEASPRDPTSYPELEVFDDLADRDHAINELLYRFDGLRWLIAEPIP